MLTFSKVISVNTVNSVEKKATKKISATPESNVRNVKIKHSTKLMTKTKRTNNPSMIKMTTMKHLTV